MSPEKQFRRINQALGKQPKIGPFPAGQILPFFLIVFLSWSIKEAFHLSWLNTFLVAIWFMGTTWILTGRQSWRFFSKFTSTPYWVRALVRYESHLFRVEIKPESRGKKAATPKVESRESDGERVLSPRVPRPPQTPSTVNTTQLSRHK